LLLSRIVWLWLYLRCFYSLMGNVWKTCLHFNRNDIIDVALRVVNLFSFFNSVSYLLFMVYISYSSCKSIVFWSTGLILYYAKILNGYIAVKVGEFVIITLLNMFASKDMQRRKRTLFFFPLSK
jgi:hypothetical protein